MPRWVYYCLCALFFFTIVNSLLNEIAIVEGPFVLFYQVGGSIVAGLAYNLYMAWQRYRIEGVFYND